MESCTLTSDRAGSEMSLSSSTARGTATALAAASSYGGLSVHFPITDTDDSETQLGPWTIHLPEGQMLPEQQGECSSLPEG